MVKNEELIGTAEYLTL